MANMKTLKGFIKNSSGDIILPISRGELIFDASGNIALHSAAFKAEAAERDATTKVIKTNTGKYGLMTPEDLLNLHEALTRISAIEVATGVTGTGSNGESLKQMLLDLIDKVGKYKGEVIGKDDEGKDITVSEDTGIYKYINDKIINHLAQSDALKFKGTLGKGGNIEALPTENINNGDTYKVIVPGLYDGKDAKIGDLFIALYTPSDGTNPAKYTWEYIPSGNEQETFIKVQLVINGETIDKTLSGTIEITGSNGVSVVYNEASNKLIITGAGYQTEVSLEEVKERLTNLETTVNGRKASGTVGDKDYVPPVQGLVQKTGAIQEKINEAVTSWDEIVEKEVGENGEATDNLKNGDDLVKASAVYDITAKLAEHISLADDKYLQAESMELSTALSATQKAYLAGTIIN